MTIDSFDVVYYTCIFLVPGFIIKSVMDTLVPPPKHNDTKYFFTCLLYSIINVAVCSWAYLLAEKLQNQHPVLFAAVVLFITLIGAVFLAVILGIIKQKGIVERCFSRIGVNKVNPIPTAWDYIFSKQEPYWVIVTLKNGKTVYGLYSRNSFSSSDSEERDIYIEKTYGLGEGNMWIEDEISCGILISKDDIETIEFLRTKEANCERTE